MGGYFVFQRFWAALVFSAAVSSVKGGMIPAIARERMSSISLGEVGSLQSFF